MKKIENPAWDYIEKIPDDKLLAGLRPRPQKAQSSLFVDGVPRTGGNRFEDMQFWRDHVTRQWTWAIPSPDAIDFVVGAVQGQGIVEIGAGNGYWAWMLSQKGVDVNAYDAYPIGHEKSWFNRIDEEDRRYSKSLADVEPTEFYPILTGSSEVLDLPENQDRTLFLCWPTMDPWAYETVSRFAGDRIIYIGEGAGGCTADSKFFKAVSGECGCWSEGHEDLCHLIEQTFAETTYFPLIQWSGINDYITVYDRKKP